MIKILRDLISKMFHTVKKEAVVLTCEFVFANINDEVIPMLETLLTHADLKKIENNPALSLMRNHSAMKAKNNRDLLIKIKNGFVGINKGYKPFMSLIETNLPDIITDKTITAKNAAILKALNDIGGMGSFVFDYVYFLLVDVGNTELPTIKFTKIKQVVPSFISSFEIYGSNFSQFIKDLDKVSNVLTADIDINNVSKDSLSNLRLASTGKLIQLPNTDGFVNNPIYHIRIWLADKDIKKYEALKDKKRLIELRLMELKLEENNESNPKLRGQIEYYENKLSKIEYTIERIENS